MPKTLILHRLIEKRREINRRKGKMGAEARRKKMMEAPAPECPLDREADFQKITISGMHFGEYREIVYALSPVEDGQGRCDQYALWGSDALLMGVMGAQLAFDRIRQEAFPRVQSARGL